jgi:hypothetical protein
MSSSTSNAPVKPVRPPPKPGNQNLVFVLEKIYNNQLNKIN